MSEKNFLEAAKAYGVKAQVQGQPSPEDDEKLQRLVEKAEAKRPTGSLLTLKSESLSVMLGHSQEKQSAVSRTADFAKKCGFSLRAREHIANAADELLMNAIFDAPLGSDGRQKHASLSRDAALKLSGRDVVSFELAFDGLFLEVTVTDQHGSLDSDKVLKHIEKTPGQLAPSEETAGAGLGLATLYRTSGGLCFESISGQLTIVRALYRKTTTFKEFKDQFRFLAFFRYL